MAEEEIVEEFSLLHRSSARSKTARLRDLFDQIEALKARGFSHATIIKAMKKHGLEFDLKTFEVTLYRIKRERAKKSTPDTERQFEVGLEDLSKNESTTAKQSDTSSMMAMQKMTKQATQAELKAIARGTIDPNQYVDE